MHFILYLYLKPFFVFPPFALVVRTSNFATYQWGSFCLLISYKQPSRCSWQACHKLGFTSMITMEQKRRGTQEENRKDNLAPTFSAFSHKSSEVGTSTSVDSPILRPGLYGWTNMELHNRQTRHPFGGPAHVG